jgi:probable rRNA maturation factor
MAAEGCHPEAELSVVIGDDRWIQALNRNYRKKDSPTDVLAFPQGESPEGAAQLLGDVAISAETAARQGAEMGHSLHQELALLLAHGILHLTGWGDETSATRRRMLQRGEQVTREALERLRD